MARIDWESRSKQHGADLKRANKKIKEVTSSRDFWKKKYMDSKKETKEMMTKLSVVKKNLLTIIEL